MGQEIMKKINNKTTKNKYSTKPVFVFYIDVRGVDSQEIPTLIHKTKDQLKSKIKEYTSFFIPQREYSTKVECIYPHFILDSEIIKKQKAMLKNLKKN